MGGCERILKTPTPLAISILLKQMLVLYFLSLPIEMIETLKWWTVPAIAIISLIFFGIEDIGSELENPFGCDPNNLPLDLICNAIYTNVEDLIKSQESLPISE